MRSWQHQASVPEMIDVTVKTPDEWLEAKSRMTFDVDRIRWDYLKEQWPKWKRDGAWIYAGGWFGFDVTHAWFIGTERELYALIDNPEWCVDMWETQLELCLALHDEIWKAGYHVDAITFAAQQNLQHFPKARFVIADKNTRGHGPSPPPTSYVKTPAGPRITKIQPCVRRHHSGAARRARVGCCTPRDRPSDARGSSPRRSRR